MFERGRTKDPARKRGREREKESKATRVLRSSSQKRGKGGERKKGLSFTPSALFDFADGRKRGGGSQRENLAEKGEERKGS